MNLVTPDPNPGRKPWSRRKGESVQAHQALIVYLDLGPGRSHKKVADALEKPGHEGQIGDWSRKWGWVDRATAYDSHQADVIQAGKDAARLKQAQLWEERRLAACEADFQLGEALRQRVRDMLTHPITKKKTSKDGKTTVIQPARWNAGNIAQLAKLAAEMQANAAKSAIPTEEKGSDSEWIDADTEAAILKVYRDDEEAAA